MQEGASSAQDSQSLVDAGVPALLQMLLLQLHQHCGPGCASALSSRLAFVELSVPAGGLAGVQPVLLILSPETPSAAVAVAVADLACKALASAAAAVTAPATAVLLLPMAWLLLQYAAD